MSVTVVDADALWTIVHRLGVIYHCQSIDIVVAVIPDVIWTSLIGFLDDYLHGFRC